MGRTTLPRGDSASLKSSRIVPPRSSNAAATLRIVAGRGASRSICMGSAFFGPLISVSPDHPGKPLHQTTDPQILALAKICRKRLDTLPLSDAGTTRVAPGASRTVHSERERYLAGPDGVPSLRERKSAGWPCRTRPVRRAVRRPVLEPALSRLRDRRDHP